MSNKYLLGYDKKGPLISNYKPNFEKNVKNLL